MKRSLIVATLLGVLTGSLLFVFIKVVMAKATPTPQPTSITLLDRSNTLLYEGDIAPSKETYKRAPFAVDLVLAKLAKIYKDRVRPQTVATTIDLPLQNFLQQAVIENQEVWKEQGVHDVAILILSIGEGGGQDLLATMGSANYFERSTSPIDFSSFSSMNIFSSQVCTTEGKEEQIYVWALDQEGRPTEGKAVLIDITRKLETFKQARGGELYGQ